MSGSVPSFGFGQIVGAEGVGQERGEGGVEALGGVAHAHDTGGRAKLADDLSARAAGGGGGGRRRVDDDAAKGAFARSHGGKDELNNLITLCPCCHLEGVHRVNLLIEVIEVLENDLIVKFTRKGNWKPI